jgi:NADP-dependent 3-hydroxy acid dehydrogenase YdfG
MGRRRRNRADPVLRRRELIEGRRSTGPSGTAQPITVVLWTAYGGAAAGDLVTADVAAIRGVFDVAIVGLLAAVQEALPDLKQTKEGAVLVANGAFGEDNPQTDALAAGAKAMGLALANAAKHKLVGLLSERLKADGVYVGEIMIAGMIKGTVWDNGNATIEGARIANKFWELYQARGEIRARIA